MPGRGSGIHDRRGLCKEPGCDPALVSFLRRRSPMEILPAPHVSHPGLLIAIGGAEDKTRERVILNYFLESAGGADASIVVLATASDTPETGGRYAALF